MEPDSLLITGGTGSFGKAFIRRLVTAPLPPARLVVYSRDELKQFEMQQEFPTDKYRFLRYFIGDVRDKDRLRHALKGIRTVVHAAALKQVPAAEYNPFECIKTNIIGAQNVIEACLETGVKRVVALSTDKAAAPINLYGATKLASDKLFVAANLYRGGHDLRLSVVRYGNVMGSRGSVIPFFLNARRDEPLPVTDARMTRFNITLGRGVDNVIFALANMWGGEIFVPKLPSYRITDVAEAIAPGRGIRIVGIRPGEKIHEEMITETDALNTLEFADYYVILPSFEPPWSVQEYRRLFKGEYCKDGFKYNSGQNSEWLDVEQIRALIKEHVDPKFVAAGK